LERICSPGQIAVAGRLFALQFGKTVDIEVAEVIDSMVALPSQNIEREL